MDAACSICRHGEWGFVALGKREHGDSQAMIRSKAFDPFYVCSISGWVVVRVVCVYGEGDLVSDCRWTGG